MSEDIEFKIVGKEMKKKTVAKQGAAAHVYLPKEWIGKKVAVILLE